MLPTPALDNFAHYVVPTKSFMYNERPQKNCLIIAPHPNNLVVLSSQHNNFIILCLYFHKYKSLRWPPIPWSIFFSQPFKAQSLAWGQEGPCVCACVCVCVQDSGSKGRPITCAWDAALTHIFHCPGKQLVTTKAFGALLSDPAAIGPFFQKTKCLHNETTHCTYPEREVPSSLT